MGKPDQPRNDDGTWKRRGRWGLGAAVVAIAVAATGGGLGGAGAVGGAAGSGSSVSSGTGGTGSSASRPGRGSSDTRAVRARDRTQDALARRLTRPGREVRRLEGDVATDCAAVSYGRCARSSPRRHATPPVECCSRYGRAERGSSSPSPWSTCPRWTAPSP